MMKPDDTQLAAVLHALRERAKELECLYRVEEFLSNPDRSLREIFQQIVTVLPPAWQYPEMCDARILFEDFSVESENFQTSQWAQSANIVVQGQPAGKVEVYYRQQVPRSDEGPFLKEERKLIETVAERIASTVVQRRLKAAHDEWQAATHGTDTSRQEWRVVLQFLRDTDPFLLKRISRRLINHLNWSGVQEAQELLQRSGTSLASEGAPDEENRPLKSIGSAKLLDLTEDAFRIAGQHLSETEILELISVWIREDKSGFLVRALETQDTPLGDIIDALERYRHTTIHEDELSHATQVGIRVALIRRFFSENTEFINTAKDYLAIEDFYELLSRIIFPPRCHGKLGGKSAGLFLAKKIIEKTGAAGEDLKRIKVPKTWYITSDWILNFVHYNELDDVLNRKYLEIDQVRQEYPHLVALFKNSSFPTDFTKALALVVDEAQDFPLIVRSSSLLEDRANSAFSGKYKSLFVGNQGTKEDRLRALMDAIAEVYASIFGPDPTEYRAERGLLHFHEEMGIMIQQVVGKKVGRYFLPAVSGVAFSNNEFRWSARIQRTDGLLRLVPGLGTRAVDRVADDYPVLIAPGQPNLRANVTVDEVLKYSPKRIDVINLESNAFETLDADRLLREYGAQYPRIRDLVSIVNHDSVEIPIGPGIDFNSQEAVFTFEGLMRRTNFVNSVRELLSLLQSKLSSPVDLEFAFDGDDFYLLQCRPESRGAETVPAAIPQNIPANRVVFSASKFISNGKIPDATHLVYVDLDGYSQLSDPNEMREVGRAVGRLNKLLPKRQFILMGPGRWGSRGDIRLGVPVTYSDINNTSLLIEVARQRGNYLPDLSFGTHFFQDLVEASIRYLPLYPDDPSTSFNDRFLLHSRNVLGDLLPEFAHLESTLRVIDIPGETGGLVLRVLMNADLNQAVAFLASPQPTSPEQSALPEGADRIADDHWRWRLRMAQRIAAQLDAEKFGAKAFYVFGSTKNATAGPGSDIDLLIHFAGTEQQREDLLLWLDGWSACLGEMNFLRTGYKSAGLLDVHLITDDDITARSSYAVKIDAITDAARKLPMKDSV
jgi:pyruvate, water dikinase